MDIREKWEARYLARTGPLEQPEPFLVSQQRELRAGSILDVACGDGRNALFLAREGWSVTGVDLASAGLARLQGFAKQESLGIETVACDLEDPSLWPAWKAFDNVVICRYKPSLVQWGGLVSLLRFGGCLLCCTFHVETHYIRGFSRRFCLEEGELVDLDPRLRLLKMERFEQDGDILVGYLFERTGV